MNSISRLTGVIAVAAFCALLAGCGRKPYVLSVRDGKGVEKGAHVFWDMGGKGTFKVVGDVTDVVVDTTAVIKFELRKEFREAIRENVSGAVLRDSNVAQGAFVLLIGGVGEDKEPLLRGVTIQETQSSAAKAFFDWLQTELPEYAKKIKDDASKAFDQASEWAGQKAEMLKSKAEELKADVPAPKDE